MWSIVIINFLIFFVQAAGGSDQMDQVDHVAGAHPGGVHRSNDLRHAAGAGHADHVTFLHANFMHVFGNMIFLFVFGDDIEEVLGHWRFLVFYLACGIGAGLTFVLSDLSSTTELIGASGAVAGVISAYLLFRPCAKIWCLLGLIPLHLRAYWIIGGWAIFQILEVSSRAQDNVAYWAHVGGADHRSDLVHRDVPGGRQTV